MALLILPKSTKTDNDSTPSVLLTNLLVINNSLETWITNFVDGQAGQLLRVLIKDQVTGISSSANIVLSNKGAYMPHGDCGGALFEFVTDDGSVWYESARVVY